MSNSYATAFTHAVLAGTSLWCIYQTHSTDKWIYATGAFGLSCINSFLGVWKYGNPEYGSKVDSIYEITDLCATLFVVPCIATNVYIHYGVERNMSLLHIGVPIIPLLLYTVNGYVDNFLVDVSVVLNCLSLGYISYNHTNYYGMYSSGCALLNHFILRRRGFSSIDMPREVLYNLGLCFFTWFAYHTLKDARVRIH